MILYNIVQLKKGRGGNLKDVECANTTRCKVFLFSEKDRLEYIECGESLLKIKYEIARCDLFR